MTVAKVFIDTNVLVYAYDESAGEKQEVAAQLVRELWDLPVLPAVSIQVLQEFFVTLVKKNVSIKNAEKIVRSYLDWDVVDNSRMTLIAAFDEQKNFHLSFWDACILAAARLAVCSEIWSEDFNSGQNYNGILAINPLKSR